MPWHIQRFPILSSTNGLALDWMESGHLPEWHVLVAGEQTSGRGRQGRKWHSLPGALLMTAVVPFRVEILGWSALTAGISVAQAARDLGAPAGVKWPNDVTLDGRKLGGILVETNVRDLAAIGIGVNVSNPLPPPEELIYPAARLLEVNAALTVEQVLEAVLVRLETSWRVLLSGELAPLQASWEELDTTRGRRVRTGEGDIAGTACGVAADGALRVRLDSGQFAEVRVGEVLFEKP